MQADLHLNQKKHRQLMNLQMFLLNLLKGGKKPPTPTPTRSYMWSWMEMIIWLFHSFIGLLVDLLIELLNHQCADELVRFWKLTLLCGCCHSRVEPSCAVLWWRSDCQITSARPCHKAPSQSKIHTTRTSCLFVWLVGCLSIVWPFISSLTFASCFLDIYICLVFFDWSAGFN